MAKKSKKVEKLPVNTPARKAIPLKDFDKLVVENAFTKFQLAQSNLDHAIAMAKIRDLEAAVKKANENIAKITGNILTEYGVSTKNSITIDTFNIVPPKGQEFIIED